MEFDIVEGTSNTMAHLFPKGTAEIHSLKLCWCHPVFRFQRVEDSLLGMVMHQ